MTVNAGDIDRTQLTAKAVVVNADTIDAGLITASNVSINELNAGSGVTVGADAAVATDATNVTVSNGNDVTISDVHTAATTFDVTAKGVVELSSVSDIDGTVTADKFIISGAESATFGTTVANLSVNDVNGAATIDNSTDLNLLDGTTKGLLDVTADGTITLPASTVTAGAVSLTADGIVIDGEAQVTATTDDIEFYAPITGAGKLTAAANDMVHFYETVTQNGEEDDTRLDLDVRHGRHQHLPRHGADVWIIRRSQVIDQQGVHAVRAVPRRKGCQVFMATWPPCSSNPPTNSSTASP